MLSTSSTLFASPRSSTSPWFGSLCIVHRLRCLRRLGGLDHLFGLCHLDRLRRLSCLDRLGRPGLLRRLGSLALLTLLGNLGPLCLLEGFHRTYYVLSTSPRLSTWSSWWP